MVNCETERGKSNMAISNISACRKHWNISMATSMFSEFSYSIGLVKLLYDLTGSWKSQLVDKIVLKFQGL